MIRERPSSTRSEDLIGGTSCAGAPRPRQTTGRKTFAGWHQDTAYADVRPIVVIVALALSRAGNGCIRAIPGSHRGKLLPHKEAFRTDSLLSREQYIERRSRRGGRCRSRVETRRDRLVQQCHHSFIKAEFRPGPPHHLPARDGADERLSGNRRANRRSSAARMRLRAFRRRSAAAARDGRGGARRLAARRRDPGERSVPRRGAAAAGARRHDQRPTAAAEADRGDFAMPDDMKFSPASATAAWKRAPRRSTSASSSISRRSSAASPTAFSPRSASSPTAIPASW